MKIYYAHPMSWYGTKAEEDDIAAISREGECVNPNSDAFRKRVDNAKRTGFPVMDVFAQTIRDTVDVVCFRRFKDGKLGAGVAREVLEGVIWGLPVWEVFGSTEKKFSYAGVHINKQVMFDPAQYDWPMDGLSFQDVLSVAETRDRIAKGEL